jgi:hypothetical protein
LLYYPVRSAKNNFKLALIFAMMATGLPAFAQPIPVLTWITNSSVKLEQIIGDVDWANGSNTTSQTITRFNIEGMDHASPFESGTNLIFLGGDLIGTNINYHAADPLAWSTSSSGEEGLLLNFYTNSAGSNVFVNPMGISMGPDDSPLTGITISNVIYLICNTGADASNTNNPHTNDSSVLVTFDERSLSFQTIRTISMVTNGGHFIFDSLHFSGSNVMMFGEGAFRASDVYLASVPTNSFLSGNGTLYFTGLTNGQPTWSSAETNAVPVVQDNPTNGPPWPNDSPSVGNVSVICAPALGLWLMTYDGGRNTRYRTNTSGIYFTYAPQPWGPWSTPQLIFNAFRDDGYGVFIHDPNHNPPGPAGPTIDPAKNDPTDTAGGPYAAYLIERFTRTANATLYIYYTMATWNPYTVVKMRSAFTITPVIGSLARTPTNFSFSWGAPTNQSYQVDYSTNLLSVWTTLTNSITSTNGTFHFTDNGTNTGGLGGRKFYRVRTLP